ETLEELSKLTIPTAREIQDYRSVYNDIREWAIREEQNKEDEKSEIDWSAVTFEVELLKSQEINLEYILGLIFETNKKVSDKDALVEEITRTIRASIGNRAKESLIIDFINQTNLDKIVDRPDIIAKFFAFAQKKQKQEVEALIQEENLNEESAKRYIMTSLKREYASDNGNDLNAALPKMSPLNPAYHTKKETVFKKIGELVEKFKGIGGEL
ncbi:type I restriction endonuclease subunit R, EcoR124 family, partial [Streptococcus sobrinus]